MTTQPDNATSWTAALDEFEARLALAEAQLASGAGDEPTAADGPYEVPAFEPPELPDALPAPLAVRAQQLLDRTADLLERLDGEQRRIREELARTPRIPPGRHAGSTLDVHA